MDYNIFIKNKSHSNGRFGFDPIFMPDYLFDFQKFLLDWAITKGRAGNFYDCGLGKTILQLCYAQNIVQYTNKNVLIVTPLSVAFQTKMEGEKFGIDCTVSRDGKITNRITITNYEKLHYFDSSDFVCVIFDESSIVKNFEGKTRKVVGNFVLKTPYRQLYTATAAPNDFIELLTSAEILGEMGRMDSLSQFFKNDENSNHPIWWGARWRFKAHSADFFWKWVCGWARAMRKPSDFGFKNEGFDLPPMEIKETIIKNDRPFNGELFETEARTLSQQRQETRLTLNKRCEMVAQKVSNKKCSVVWGNLNSECDLMEKLIPNAKQIAGRHSDEQKEELFKAFVSGELPILITKPKIGGFGLNWQHCNHMTFFPTHSWEQFYQCSRRIFRFGQKNNVLINVITTGGLRGIFLNLERKRKLADQMFDKMIALMNESLKIDNATKFTKKLEVPKWM